MAQNQLVLQATGWEGLKVRGMDTGFSLSELYADAELVTRYHDRNLKTRHDGAATELSEKVRTEQTKALP